MMALGLFIHPEGNMNVCTKFYGNRSKSCEAISVIPHNVKFMVALEKLKYHQSQQGSVVNSS